MIDNKKVSLTPISGVTWLPSPLSESVDASFSSRLCTLVQDKDSEALALFSPEFKAQAAHGDWYGEHLGKWLCAASLALSRTQSSTLRASIKEAVIALSEWQEPDGYLGTYEKDSSSRLTHPNAGQCRTWDVWIHSWAIRGLLAASRCGVESDLALATTHKAADLLVSVIKQKGRDFLTLGNHKGLSAAIAIDALAEMGAACDRKDCLEAASSILGFLEESGICILSGPNLETDVAQLGTGKVYQIIWVLLGMAKLAKAASDSTILDAVVYWWHNIRDHHLTPFGGPWGGIGGHFEVFNQQGFFSPEGMVETCSTATWISLSRELYSQTGCHQYLEACEQSLLNGILGAIDQNGYDWSYFSFPNGRRNSTYHWACCRSSGALALEEAATLPLWKTDIGYRLTLLQPLTASFDGVKLSITQLSPSRWGVEILESDFENWTLEILIPQWADGVEVTDANGDFLTGRREQHIVLQGPKKTGCRYELHLNVKTRVNSFTDIKDHHGQEIQRTDYACVTWGPYVYAAGLIDGYRKQETLRMAKLFPLNSLVQLIGENFPSFQMRGQGRTMVKLDPFFMAGGRHDGAWRALWLQVAWQ